MYYEISRSAKIKALPLLLNFVESSSIALALPTKFRHKLLIVVEELFTNTIKYGGPRAQQGKIWLSLGVRQKRLHLQYQDQGIAFDPFTDARCASANNPNREGGVGIALIIGFMDACHYKRACEHNYLEMIKKL